MSCAILKNICSGNFLQIIIKASATEFICSIHAFSIFIQARLRGCVWSMSIILWEVSYFRYSINILTAKASLQKFLMEILMKSEKQCFQLFVDWTHTLVLCARLWRVRSGAQVKLRARKIGLNELNLSTPALGLVQSHRLASGSFSVLLGQFSCGNKNQLFRGVLFLSKITRQILVVFLKKVSATNIFLWSFSFFRSGMM